MEQKNTKELLEIALGAINTVIAEGEQNITDKHDQVSEWYKHKEELEAELKALEPQPVTALVNGFPVEVYLEKDDRYIMLTEGEINYDADHVYTSDWGDFKLSEDTVKHVQRMHHADFHLTATELKAFFRESVRGGYDGYDAVLSKIGYNTKN